MNLKTKKIHIRSLIFFLQDIFRFFNNPAQRVRVHGSTLLSELLANIQNVFLTAITITCLPFTKVLTYKVYYQLSDDDSYLLQNNALHGMLFSNTNYHARFDQEELRDLCITTFEIQQIHITESSKLCFNREHSLVIVHSHSRLPSHVNFVFVFITVMLVDHLRTQVLQSLIVICFGYNLCCWFQVGWC
jgi:hypothetical protein